MAPVAVAAFAFAAVAAASSLFSSQCYEQAAEAVALGLSHHCTPRKTLQNGTETLLNALPFEVTSSTNLGEH